MKIIVTGGSGFIGTNLIEHYIKKKINVFNFDIKPPQNQEHEKYWHKVDLANYPDFFELFNKINPKYLIHLAARADLSGKNYNDYYVNVQSVKNIIKVCRNHSNVKRVIFASTMLVNQTGYKPKNILDYNPNTLYGESKVEGENIILNNKDCATDLCIIRPTSIWGEWFREPYKNFFDFVLNEKFFHPGSKACSKTFGYVGNAVYQIDKLLLADPKKIRNKIFYIGDKPSVNISKWANEIALLAGVKKPKKIPFFVFKLLGFVGDFIVKFGVKFPMTSYRLKNMTTDQIHNLNDTYDVCGVPPYERKIAIKRTLKWISQE